MESPVRRVEVTSPFPAAAWPQVWSWIESFRDRALDDAAPQNLGDFVRECELLAPLVTTWAVRVDGELGGVLIAQQVSPIAWRVQPFFRREFWGQKIARPAMAGVLAKLFERGAVKIIGFPFEDNHAMHAFLKKLGYRVEGKLNAQTLRGGRVVSQLVFGLQKEDLCRSAEC